MNWVYAYLAAEAAMSLTAFWAYGLDKRRAKRGRWRIREKTLLLLAACFGAPGAYAGMMAFRHKTKHTSFRLIVPLCLILQAAALAWLIWRAA